jgi:phosphoribosylaminoimidazole-succinocarboxamide synthase
MERIENTQLPLKLFKKGKVREVYEAGNNELLIVSSDRISAFDFVLPSIIPDKGKVLNQIAGFWFNLTKDQFPNHMLCETPENLDLFKDFANSIKGRSILTKKLTTFPIEAIVRGYIVGSGWKSYQESGEICGITLPSGLKFGDKFPTPLFTPTSKADIGHDENMSFSEMAKLLGAKNAELIKNISINLYNYAADYARKKGIIIADTKFEFGRDENGQIVLIDEIFTPDSSRFWKIEDYDRIQQHAPGQDPPSFDKQFVRNFLLNSNWDRKSIPPPLPEDVISKTREKYLEIFSILTGKQLACL